MRLPSSSYRNEVISERHTRRRCRWSDTYNAVQLFDDGSSLLDGSHLDKTEATRTSSLESNGVLNFYFYR